MKLALSCARSFTKNRSGTHQLRKVQMTSHIVATLGLTS
jgi:hypothetical protein